jgi:hypothetical protein
MANLAIDTRTETRTVQQQVDDALDLVAEPLAQSWDCGIVTGGSLKDL